MHTSPAPVPHPSYRDAALEAPDLDGEALEDMPGAEPRVAVRVARATHARVELVVQLLIVCWFGKKSKRGDVSPSAFDRSNLQMPQTKRPVQSIPPNAHEPPTQRSTHLEGEGAAAAHGEVMRVGEHEVVVLAPVHF